MRFYLIAFTLLFVFITDASADVLDRKGKWSFFYGYNRASYSNSDYHLKGNNYDFTLKNVVAHDGQSDLGVSPYLLPWDWSVPQNNIRFGYFITDNFSVSFGNDHMKYIMDNAQTVDFEGTIATGEGFDRSGKGTQKLDNNFLRFEHTDGLNFVSIEFEHFIPLWVGSKKSQALSVYWGPGIALLYPRTNSNLFGRGRNDKFHLAGSGYSLKVGLEFNITERYFTRLVVKHGHINMPDVRTTSDASDKLSQEFSFKETYLVFGVNF
jgi:hypothetical protein